MSARDGDSSPLREGVCRRDALGAIAGLISIELLGIGCVQDEPARSNQIAIALSDLPPGRRMIVAINGNPVEVMRAGDTVRARLLRCTHAGCVVKWKPDQNAYLCPCHDGRYDEDGIVISGPPPLPLRAVQVTVLRGRVLVGG